MQRLIKNIGETPLELIRRTFPDWNERKYTYAGRLDPMASGLILILEGDEVQEKEKYLELDKTYELEILFGVSTDSYDTLGLITDYQTPKADPPWTDTLTQTLADYPRVLEQPYPPYSSRTVQGKPLWMWAKEGRLDELTIPTKTVTLHELKLNSLTRKPLSTLIPQIISNINLVTGKFRQNEIISAWQTLLEKHQHEELQVASLTVTCSSGTYMRSLGNDLGKQLKIPSLALSIARTRVGDYSISSR